MDGCCAGLSSSLKKGFRVWGDIVGLCLRVEYVWNMAGKALTFFVARLA